MITDLTDSNNDNNNNNDNNDNNDNNNKDHEGHDHAGNDQRHPEGPDHAGHEGGDPTGTDQRAGLVERALLGAIGLYRMTAPVRTPRCRYIPSCSEYAAEAIEKHGPVRGLWLALRRLGRCHPFGSFGFDPVPDKRPEKNPEKKT